jgi:hypothetical protein
MRTPSYAQHTQYTHAAQLVYLAWAEPPHSKRAATDTSHLDKFFPSWADTLCALTVCCVRGQGAR